MNANTTRTQVQRLAAYAHRAQFGDLSPESVRQLPVHVLDCLGCCLAAPGAPPVDACRAQVQDFAGTGPCSLIAGGSSNPVYAAFWHTALVRYVDFMDNFLAPTETCHTADNFGGVLTAAEYAGASGRDLMLGVALAYTVQSRFTDHANFMTRGFDVTAHLAFSVPAAAGRLLGMSEAQIAARHRDGRLQRRLLRQHQGQAAVAVERTRLGPVRARRDERAVPRPPRGAGPARRDRGNQRHRQPPAHAGRHRLGA